MLKKRTPVILLCGFLLSALSAAAQGQQLLVAGGVDAGSEEAPYFACELAGSKTEASCSRADGQTSAER